MTDTPDRPRENNGGGPTNEPKRPNISTEHQEEGDALKPSETLDRDQTPPQDDGGRKSSLLWNE